MNQTELNNFDLSILEQAEQDIPNHEYRFVLASEGQFHLTVWDSLLEHVRRLVPMYLRPFVYHWYDENYRANEFLPSVEFEELFYIKIPQFADMAIAVSIHNDMQNIEQRYGDVTVRPRLFVKRGGDNWETQLSVFDCPIYNSFPDAVAEAKLVYIQENG